VTTFLALVVLATTAAGSLASSPPIPPPSSASAPSQAQLDALMREVLERRDAATRALAGLRFRETEELTVRGQEEVAPLQSSTKVFDWRGRAGTLERDPVSVNGSLIEGEPLVWDLVADDEEGRLSGARFSQWDSLFHFPYEPGRYLLAGREQRDGRQVLRVEYYPRRWFARDDDESSLGRDFDRTSLITLWVIAEERRLVALRYHNIGMQFLPLRWLVQVQSLDAEMIIDAAADGTWLPRRLSVNLRASMAPAQITIALTRTFGGYTRADGSPVQALPALPGNEDVFDQPAPADDSEGGGAVAAVGFQGNYSLPDGELGGIAGVTRGEEYVDGMAAEVRGRLLGSELVDRAAVRVRPVDIDRSDEVSLMSVVRQRVGWGDHVQVLPLFEWSDEYGVTAGGRVSLVQMYGADDRLSFPLAVGGRDMVRAEFTDDFDHRFLSGVRADGGFLREVNPHYQESETRVGANARVFRRFAQAQFEVEAGVAEVEFQGVTQRQVSWGIGGRFDTRRETGLPRNAVYAAAAWKPLAIIEGDYTDRFELDLRGYVGVASRSTLVIGARYDGADGELPPYEKFLLGGLSTLRGFEPGQFIGDNRVTASVELRTPVWEPVPIVIIGVNGFWDTGTVWDYGSELSKARFHNGVGGGAFLMAGFVRLNVDLGYGLGEGWQFHIGSGLRY
jgi:hypothetical protein